MKFEYKVETLPNGLRVVTVPMEVPTVTALVMVGVGSRFEKEEKAGISHFVEHLVFKGTKKYPSALAVSSAVDAVGAEFNAFTSKEYTGFYVKAASEHLELALNILSQFCFKPLLKADDIEREKGVIVEEINMYEDTPMRQVGNVFDRLIYEGCSLGRDVIGEKATVTSVDRRDFVAHMEEWYRPGKMVLGIAGDTQKVQSSKFKVQSLVEKYFNGSQRSEIRDQKLKKVDIYESRQARPQVKVEFKKTEQAHFVLGVGTIKRGHKDRYVQSVLTTILGGNMSSRLFSEVREKRGLAYYVRSSTAAFADTGYFESQAGVTLDKIDEAIEAIVKHYQKISNSDIVSREELKKAKDYLKGKLLIELEDSFEVASMFTEALLMEGKVRTPEEIIEGVGKVSTEDVTRFAQEIFRSEKLNLAAIGPYKDSQKFFKLLRI